ncbi:MAG: 23S rRNA (uracil(1939)-C(5))-methyltransferase RlmD [Chlamydiae bacterium]|nr:23S rRNA (uracil(1939)-C(5))-methyltransferase RlmD [Chlamydiota bacterium]
MSKTPFTKIDVLIEKFAAKGYGVGFASKQEGLPKHKIEVPHTVPGDRVQVEIGRKHSGTFHGFSLQVLNPSIDRVPTRCLHASSCGGCVWQQMSYQRQLEHKARLIQELFAPYLSQGTEVFPIIECTDPWAYRNKMEYTFSQNKGGEKFLGLIMTGGRGRVFNLTECHLTHPWFQETVKAVRGFWEVSALKAYNMRDNSGSLRNLTLRKAEHTQDRLAMLTVSGHPDYALKRLELDALVKVLLEVVPIEEHPRYSIFLRVQQILKGSPTQFYEMHLHGPDCLTEQIHLPKQAKDFSFKISPTAFFQPNTLQAEKLYSKALDMVGEDPLSHVLDLYAGTSTLGILFSSQASQVTSIEINPHAVFDAEVNKEWNNISNLTVKRGDVAEVLAELRKDPGFQTDLVVLDPPRAGLDDKALSHVADLLPDKILYISCNPSTQAINIQYFIEHGYRLTAVQAIDQFPHTIHLENICLLKRVVP